MIEKGLKPFDRVLVRGFFGNDEYWGIEIFGYYEKDAVLCSSNMKYTECIRYEGNEHLLGTKRPYQPEWEPAPGEIVAVWNDDENNKKIRIYVEPGGLGTFRCFERIPTGAGTFSTEIWHHCEPLPQEILDKLKKEG